MVGVLGGDVVDDLGGEVVGGEGGRYGDGNFVAVGVAVVGVVGELAADGLLLLHEDAGLLAHVAVEAIHDQGGGAVGAPGAVDGEEVFGLGEPGGVGNLFYLEARGDGGGEVEAELALGGDGGGEAEVVLLLELEAGPGRGSRG